MPHRPTSRALLLPAPALLATVLLACPAPERSPEPEPEPDSLPDCSVAPRTERAVDEYGGLTDLDLGGTGFFRLAEAGGRTWMVDPHGHPLISQAVNHVTPRGDQDIETGGWPYGDTVAALYADEAAWADATVERLHAWGFHHLGAWLASDHLRGRLPETPILGIGGVDWLVGDIADVFDPAFEAGAAQRAQEQVAPRADDPLVVGWFLDNEMRWGNDWRGNEDLAELVWLLGPDSPSRARLIEMLRDRHADDVGSFETAWQLQPGALPDWDALDALPELPPDGGGEDRRAWEDLYADRWFEVTTSAVRAVDPNHLLLGVRFVAQTTPSTVVEAAGRWLDVLSVNRYTLIEGIEELLQDNSPHFARTGDDLAPFHELSGLPLLISETGFRAADAGLPNSWPPIQAVYETQTDRADAFEAYAHAHLAPPFAVGLHWFEWVDEPPGGRFDGENSNWGLVGLDDTPYDEDFVERTATEGTAWAYDCWAPLLEP